jgi:hypothetical protein
MKKNNYSFLRYFIESFTLVVQKLLETIMRIKYLLLFISAFGFLQEAQENLDYQKPSAEILHSCRL